MRDEVCLFISVALVTNTLHGTKAIHLFTGTKIIACGCLLS